MSDGIFINFEVEFNPGVGEGFLLSLPEDLKATRNFAGCRSVTAYRNTASPDRFMILEHWDSREAHAAYFKWRQDSGAFDKLAPSLAAPPTNTFWEAVA